MEERAKENDILSEARIGEAERWLSERQEDIPADVVGLIKYSKAESSRRAKEIEDAHNRALEAALQGKEAARPPILGKSPSFVSVPGRLPTAEPPPVPDTVLDGADLDGLTIRAASLRGEDHRYMANIRQDSMGMWRLANAETSAILICVADGVSSERLSHRGSAGACQLLRDEIEPRLTALLNPERDARLAELGQELMDGVAQSSLSLPSGKRSIPDRCLQHWWAPCWTPTRRMRLSVDA